MKTYLAIFTGGPESFSESDWSELSEEERKAREQKGMAAWGAWMHENGAALAFTGGPLGKTKKVSKKGVADISNQMTGVVAIKASSHDEAAKKFLDHPHFTIFPGDGVEIMEVLPIPGR